MLKTLMNVRSNINNIKFAKRANVIYADVIMILTDIIY